MVITAIRSRLRQRSAERDHFALDRTAGHMLDDYRCAVKEGESREVLAEILTGLAGCELAMSRTNPVMGWGLEPDKDGCTVGESARRSGLLVQELAYAAGDIEYRGVRAFEFQWGDIAHSLTDVALAYREWAPNPRGNLGTPDEPVPVGQRLDELWHVMVGAIGGQAAEVLAPLMAAHSHCIRCDCDKHGGVPLEEAPCD